MPKRIYIEYFKKYGFLSRGKEVVFLMVLAFLTLGAGPCSQEFPTGVYRGKLSSQGVLNDLRDSPVLVKIVNLNHGRGRIIFYSEQQDQDLPVEQELFSIEISHFKSRFQTVRSFDVAIPFMQIEPIHLKKSPAGESDYLGNSSNGQYEIHMSYQPLELEVITKEGHAALKATASAKVPGFQRDGSVRSEVETHFTSDQLVERALKWNAQLLEQKEEVIQARAAAQSAFARLLPHFTLSSVMEIVSFSGGEAIFNLVGHLIPFVFPDNWTDHKELVWQYRAAKVAEDLLRSQLITHVQSLSVDYINYTEYKERLQSLQDQLKVLMSTYKQAVSAGRLADMSQSEWALLEFESDQLENEAISVQQRIEQNRSDLARAIGVANPRVVATLSLSPGIVSFDRIPILSTAEEYRKKESWAKFAAEYSLEVRQQEYLKFAALAQEKGFWLHWLNPNCKEEYSLGFHLGAERKIVKSQLRVFDIHMSDLKKATHLLTYYWVRDRNVKAQQAVRLGQHLRTRLNRLDQGFSQAVALVQTSQPLVEGSVASLAEALYQTRETLVQYFGAKSVAMINQLYLDRIAFRGQHVILKKHLDHDPAFSQVVEIAEEIEELAVPEEITHPAVKMTKVQITEV